MATNPNAVFPEHNPSSNFSFPKEEEKVRSQLRLPCYSLLTPFFDSLGARILEGD
jgi:hypothetical protein